MSNGTITAIHITESEGSAMLAVDDAEAIAGKGIAGDRYALKAGKFSGDTIEPKHQLTLIESEAIEAAARDHGIELAPGATRRNITTAGVALNHLVGREFGVGGARLRGVKLCEPCGYLERLLEMEDVKKSLVHRGGLRCEVVQSGRFKVGDAIQIDA